ncbi:hypothetical protein ANN_22034 [Periplaneta americana]|uniref:Uncharacterized protein n=1 Tax=Periplaneta americana TaxID=6978 RepID=A0ABQ8S7J4_PERAM|nr:hypothetical protein ANN_22034 [Periplaneta americana]
MAGLYYTFSNALRRVASTTIGSRGFAKLPNVPPCSASRRTVPRNGCARNFPDATRATRDSIRAKNRSAMPVLNGRPQDAFLYFDGRKPATLDLERK